MVTALYRRYRPENFAELIGQTQVTDPLRTALRTNRVNHAYLFSGPRGCGKTTSARILARCLNCAQGPTDTPCGVCASCVELSRDGGGSLDVIEIDAASHNGVDDARDIRDRAVFAPARDRFKIFILDEAHMVTPQGFNALLKVVEEPPEHVKFIFATTEPDKVIGTIRSRTHHYPFRLVPPAQMLEYVHELCESESVEAAPGVLPLVVRAGGGSVRDTLSLLDQLMAGSEDGAIQYERAVALLGYTHASLLDDVVEALGARDGAAAFAAVDRVVQTGQDPRRFVEDLLERLRDLIVVGATVEGASAVLRGVTADELDRLVHQSHAFGAAELSRSADVVNRALTDMTGATSPRLHLELMIARVLVPESDQTGRGALARVERLERRVGVEGSGSGPSAVPGPSAAPSTQAAARPAEVRTAGRSTPPVAASAPSASAPSASAPSASPVEATPSTEAAGGPSAVESATASWATAAPSTSATRADQADSATPTEPAPPSAPHSAAWAQSPDTGQASGSGAAPVTLQQLRDSWPEIVEVVQKARRTAWMVVVTATVVDFVDDVLTLAFPSANDVESFKRPQGAAEGVSEYLRRAIVDVLGVKVKYIARVEGDGPAGPTPTGAPVDAAAPPATSGAPRETGRSTTPAPEAGRQPSGPASPGSAPSETGRATAPAATSSTPEASASPAPSPSLAPAPAAAPEAAARSGAPAPASAGRSGAPASASAGRSGGSTPVTGWDVAPIPQTPPPSPTNPSTSPKNRPAASRRSTPRLLRPRSTCPRLAPPPPPRRPPQRPPAHRPPPPVRVRRWPSVARRPVTRAGASPPGRATARPSCARSSGPSSSKKRRSPPGSRLREASSACTKASSKS
ncbi:DNA polymerase III subunit gamma and tau [Frigoribacterium sp. SL97]|uniref:DNA polymerase III subunit gamma and tau n=1 Tax=Frigoribacterium sp. SL97 TaxID=2994664 RepID=UPI00226F337B|nr:DNA polymerase III subunit gamma and tau [Frigoribacterium sp. SL97]WAC51092.1 DNA polymerase III subunit gamma and tau [Frigoribacterium sp. SL97]